MAETYQKLNMRYQKILANPQPVSFHDHDNYHDYEIFFLLSGRGSITIEQTAYFLKPADLVIMNNREIRQDFLTAEKAAEYIEIHFAPDLLAPFSQSFNLYRFVRLS